MAASYRVRIVSKSAAVSDNRVNKLVVAVRRVSLISRTGELRKYLEVF